MCMYSCIKFLFLHDTIIERYRISGLIGLGGRTGVGRFRLNTKRADNKNKKYQGRDTRHLPRRSPVGHIVSFF